MPNHAIVWLNLIPTVEAQLMLSSQELRLVKTVLKRPSRSGNFGQQPEHRPDQLQLLSEMT